MATAVRVITNINGAYTIPADFAAGSSLQVECIGGGSIANGGGGAYSKTNAITGLSAGQTVYIKAGGAGVDSWFNKAANSSPASTTNGALAKAGIGSGNNLASGGQASAGIGDLKYSGGNGGPYVPGCSNDSVGGGGGAAGPNGNGANASTTFTGGGGGGANGGSAGGQLNGGNGRGGSGGGTYSISGSAGNGSNGGGGGGTDTGTAGGGGPDLVFTDTVTGVSWGPCGGGGGSFGSTSAGTAGYGGGACRSADIGTVNSSQGIVVFTYTSTAAAASTSNFFMFF
jgi:hypothetical protein